MGSRNKVLGHAILVLTLTPPVWAGCGSRLEGPDVDRRSDAAAGPYADDQPAPGSSADAEAPPLSDEGRVPAPPVGAGSGGPPALPKATRSCPQIVEGEVRVLGARVQVWVDRNVTAKGPLVFYWHGTASSPLEALLGLGGGAIDEIKARGGMVVAPFGPTGLSGDQTGGVVWRSGDLALADEILACAVQQVGIDTARIHSVGLSAGGLHTTIMTFSRSGYLASVASFSGGLVPILPPPANQYPANKLPAMIVHGGDEDQLSWFSFKESSEKYLAALRAEGHFAFICDHGQGHTIPPNVGPGVWRFFRDHPWGTDPSPYEAGLPSALPGYCSLP